MNLIFEYAAQFWFVVGIILILLEFAAIPGIGFLFVGFGSFTTALLLSLYPELITYQIIVIGFTSLFWFLILWWPLNKFLYKTTNESYSDMIGGRVVVMGKDLEPGEFGIVTWSGTVMKARLADDESEAAKLGQTIYISEVQGNVLICSKDMSKNKY